MSYQQIPLIEIYCDFPGCDESRIFSDEFMGLEKINKMIKAIGWTELSFPSDDEDYGQTNLNFCPDCKDKKMPINEDHECVYIRKTKKGKVSNYGSVFECIFCERLKK